MSTKGYAVRLHAIEGEHAATAQALSRVFGLDIDTAAQLLRALPRVVKQDASQEDAERIAAALQAIGARVEVFARPLQPARVMLVGTPQPDTRPPAPANQQVIEAEVRRPAAPASTQVMHAAQPVATPWGALELESLTPRTSRGNAARLQPMAAAPAPVPSFEPEQLPVMSRSPEHEHALELAEAMPAQALARDHFPMPAEAIARDRFALPADPPPSAASPGVRPASARLQSKPKRALAGQTSPKALAPKPHVLAAHPLARFLLALGATSAVFLLALALL